MLNMKKICVNIEINNMIFVENLFQKKDSIFFENIILLFHLFGRIMNSGIKEKQTESSMMRYSMKLPIAQEMTWKALKYLIIILTDLS